MNGNEKFLDDEGCETNWGKRYKRQPAGITLSDKKIPVDANNDFIADYYKADIVSAQDYYPFGMLMPERQYNTSKYTYSFNGKLRDDNVYGKGNFYNYGFRMYDSRLGRFLSVDPLTKKYPWLTPYQFAGNSPIKYIDRDGLEKANNKSDANKQTGTKIVTVIVTAKSLIYLTNDIKKYPGFTGTLFRHGAGVKLVSTTTLKVKVGNGNAAAINHSFQQNIKFSHIGDVYKEKGLPASNPNIINDAFKNPLKTKNGGVAYATEAQARPALSAQMYFEATDQNKITITQTTGITVSNSGEVNVVTNASTFPTTIFNVTVTTQSQGSSEKHIQTAVTKFQQQSLNGALGGKFKTHQQTKKAELSQ